MALTPEEKEARARQRMIENARCLAPDRYARKTVAPIFQKMIRAEAAANPDGCETAIKCGSLSRVHRQVGECVCVTCGKVGPWKGTSVYGGIMDTGHFFAGRSNSILFEETGANPQCKHCNKQLSGNQANYEIWMRHVHGQEEIDRLRRLKNETRKFTHEELVDMNIEYRRRLKAAEERMQKNG